ncbi:CotO family spore coat protein [Oceanobacillus salinisoli]|uniref:CotO family spore coat protein n=1 Tax=Oceanobacillus salinisoli TaxID=2678611 RepID=UPI0018CC62B8|nr:CotO family spore coat protein [Oceanobacillus salinisoli]
MGRGKFANDPLLFIHQAKTSKPKAPMQDRYMSPKKRENNINEKSSTEESTKEIPRKRYASKKPLKQASAMEEEAKDEKNEQQERKQFKDMTIKERIEHFANTSQYAPKVRCEVKTDKKSFKGIISSFKDNKVEMQIGKRVFQIPFDEIKDVRLLGF